MRDRPKTKSQRKAAEKARAIDAQARAAAVHGSAGTSAIRQSSDRLGTIGSSSSVL